MSALAVALVAASSANDSAVLIRPNCLVRRMLDLWWLYRCNQRIHQKPILFVNDPLSLQLNPVRPQKTVGESDSSTIYCG
jgi:hypothetical protein